MAFSTKTGPSRFIFILLISSLSYQSTNSQNLDTASPIPKILENNDLGRIDVGIDEQNGKYKFSLSQQVYQLNFQRISIMQIMILFIQL